MEQSQKHLYKFQGHPAHVKSIEIAPGNHLERILLRLQYLRISDTKIAQNLTHGGWRNIKAITYDCQLK